MPSSTPTANTTWSCAQCSATFDKSKLLERHTLQTSHEAYKCLICLKVFGKRTALIRHKATHSNAKGHICRVCKKAFYRKDHCAEHEEVCTHRLAVDTKARLSASLTTIDGSGPAVSPVDYHAPRETAFDHAPEHGISPMGHRPASENGKAQKRSLSAAGQRSTSPLPVSGPEPSSQQNNVHKQSPTLEQRAMVSLLELSSDLSSRHPEAMATLRQLYSASVDSNPQHDAFNHTAESGSSQERHWSESTDRSLRQTPLIPEHEMAALSQFSDVPYSANDSSAPAFNLASPQQNAPKHVPSSGNHRKRHQPSSGDSDPSENPLSAHEADRRPRAPRRIAGSEHLSQQNGIYGPSAPPNQQGRPLASHSHKRLAMEPHDSHADLSQFQALLNESCSCAGNGKPTTTQDQGMMERYMPPTNLDCDAPASFDDYEVADENRDTSDSTSRAPTDVHLPDRGTHTCILHGCTQRFDSPASFQRHEQDFHRGPPLEDVARRSMSPPVIDIEFAPRGPRTQRDDSLSSPIRALNPQLSSADSANRYGASSFWSSLTSEVQELKDSFKEDEEENGEQAPKMTTSSSGALPDTSALSFSKESLWIRQPRILLVEDNKTSRRIASKWLYSFGCIIVTAEDGVEAVNSIHSGDNMLPDLIFMDIIMPNLDDVSAFRLIRQVEQGSMPIIIMTSNMRSDDIAMCFEHGVSDVLPKPFTKEGMFRQLEKHLQHLMMGKSTDALKPSPALVGPDGSELHREAQSKRVHKHPATFQCNLCSKRFSRACDLRAHLRMHGDELPFVCTVCGKAFARQHDRKRPEGMHSGEKNFVCRGTLRSGSPWGCCRRFARADALGRHFRSQAGAVCIKALLDEDVAERQRT